MILIGIPSEISAECKEEEGEERVHRGVRGRKVKSAKHLLSARYFVL